MSALSGAEIRRRIYDEKDDTRRLYITPILDLDAQIRNSSGSFDIRLGTHFIVTKRTDFSHINPFGLSEGREHEPSSEEDIRLEFTRYQSEIFVPLSSGFVLHPQQFALGASLEYFRFPLDVIGYVVGRSSWGRLGLVIAMATVVHPGYTGVITLELQNLGDVPITLATGARIGQLVFHTIEGDTLPGKKLEFRDVYSVKYVAATKPSYSLIYEDSERRILDQYGKFSKSATEVLSRSTPVESPTGP